MARYFHTLIDKYSRFNEATKINLALASYNAGPNHINDIILLAEKNNEDIENWNILKAYLFKLNQKKYYKKMKFGYARGWEAVQYIENVKQYYDIITFLENKDKDNQDIIFNEGTKYTMKNQELINDAFDNGINDDNRSDVNIAVEEILEDLNEGAIRVAKSSKGVWTVNEYAKKAILLSFKLNQNKYIETNYTRFYDKVDSKFLHTTEDYLRENNIRIVPQAIARHGAFIDKNVVLMPSFVNIGAYVGEGTMVDTWATVGSCAQIGSNVHLSGGVGIGGVLEPLQASPTIIEDNCFIGARSEVVEGVIVRKIL